MPKCAAATSPTPPPPTQPYKNEVISSSRFYSISCLVVELHQGTTVWFRESDARLLLWAKKRISATLWYSGLPYLLHVEDFAEDVSIGKAVREIFLMCQCYSMSLQAISPPQRESAEGVTLFCALIGLLSRIVEEDNFWKFLSNRYK